MAEDDSRSPVILRPHFLIVRGSHIFWLYWAVPAENSSVEIIGYLKDVFSRVRNRGYARNSNFNLITYLGEFI